jgi:predicted HD phosphohydrolase
MNTRQLFEDFLPEIQVAPVSSEIVARPYQIEAIEAAFCEWKTRCGRVNDDSFDIMCDKTLIKIMGNEFNQDATFNKMRGVMYNKMKTDMKAIVEYEFEF